MSARFRALSALLLLAGIIAAPGLSTARADELTGDATRLPPVPTGASFALSQDAASLGQPVDVRPRNDEASAASQSSLLWSGSLSKRLAGAAQQPPDSQPASVQPVTWSALELAQRTVPQSFYGGADYLLLKPRLDAVAFYTTTGLFGVQATAQSFDFGYQSAPRVFIGYRDADSGSALQFTYWNCQGNDTQNFTADNFTQSILPNSPFVILPAIPALFGDTITAQMQLKLNVYDIEFYKPVALSGGRWLLTGSIGARILDYTQNVQASVRDSGGNSIYFQENSLQYTGAGPRASFEARRIIGANGALYARGGYAVLIGTETTTVDVSQIVPPSPFSLGRSSTGAISNGDFELGGSWRLGNHVVLSAGWMLSAFTGLGGAPGQLTMANTNNLLSFDGLVARAAIFW